MSKLAAMSWLVPIQRFFQVLNWRWCNRIAATLVHKDVPAGAMAGGNLMRIILQRKMAERKLDNPVWHN